MPATSETSSVSLGALRKFFAPTPVEPELQDKLIAQLKVAAMAPADIEQAVSVISSAGAVADVVRYIEVVQPGEFGTIDEIKLFLNLRKTQNVFSLAQQYPLLRNYHHYSAQTLQRLAANYGDRSRSKPLTVVVMPTGQNSSTFAQSGPVAEVVANSHNLALVVEAPSLQAIAGRIEELAAVYGQDGLAKQVILAGHGSPSRILIGGSAAGRPKPKDQEVSVAEGAPERAASKQFLGHVVESMHDDGQLLLVGCNTGMQSEDGGATLTSVLAEESQARGKRVHVAASAGLAYPAADKLMSPDGNLRPEGHARKNNYVSNKQDLITYYEHVAKEPDAISAIDGLCWLAKIAPPETFLKALMARKQNPASGPFEPFLIALLEPVTNPNFAQLDEIRQMLVWVPMIDVGFDKNCGATLQPNLRIKLAKLIVEFANRHPISRATALMYLSAEHPGMRKQYLTALSMVPTDSRTRAFDETIIGPLAEQYYAVADDHMRTRLAVEMLRSNVAGPARQAAQNIVKANLRALPTDLAGLRSTLQHLVEQ